MNQLPKSWQKKKGDCIKTNKVDRKGNLGKKLALSNFFSILINSLSKCSTVLFFFFFFFFWFQLIVRLKTINKTNFSATATATVAVGTALDPMGFLVS